MALLLVLLLNWKINIFLVTNWHVLNGENPETGQLLHTATKIDIYHHMNDDFYEWTFRTENLYDQRDKPRWLEHPLGKKRDVVLLPLEQVDEMIKIHALDLNLIETDMVPEIAMRVCIIGFPFGYCGGGNYPIWKTGHIASEPNLDYDALPVFLIDATTKQGMSGAPVILRMNGGYRMKNGGFAIGGPVRNKFLGIYSGRIRNDSELGRVWKPSVIEEIIAHAGINFEKGNNQRSQSGSLWIRKGAAPNDGQL